MRLFVRSSALMGFVVLVGLGGGQAGALAQTPVCPDNSNAVDVNYPDYLRVDKSFAVEAYVGEGYTAAQVANLSVTVGPTTVPLTFDESDTAKAILAGPRKSGRINVRFTWDQDGGTTAACRGVYSDWIQAVPTKATVGRSQLLRLAGSYTLRIKRAGHTDHLRWNMNPRCDYFGCSTRAKSRTGKGILLRPRGARYHYRARGPRDTSHCKVKYIDGSQETIRPLFHISVAIEIQPSHARNGVARRFSGTEVFTYTPTDEAEVVGCATHSIIRRFKLTGVRR